MVEAPVTLDDARTRKRVRNAAYYRAHRDQERARKRAWYASLSREEKRDIVAFKRLKYRGRA